MPHLINRPHSMLIREQQLWSEGFSMLAGIDEAGRGPLAGPVVAACVYLEPSVWIEGINDSKKLSESKREALYHQLMNTQGVHYGVGEASSSEIDEINILQATHLAMKRAYENLNKKIDYVLVDGLYLPLDVPSEKIIKGDAKSYFIASASIIAKVTRDQIMKTLDEKYPQYGFKKHKGYGTKAHRNALDKHGPCIEHRKTFEPIKSWLLENTATREISVYSG